MKSLIILIAILGIFLTVGLILRPVQPLTPIEQYSLKMEKNK
jgi:hypothetical protein